MTVEDITVVTFWTWVDTVHGIGIHVGTFRTDGTVNRSTVTIFTRISTIFTFSGIGVSVFTIWTWGDTLVVIDEVITVTSGTTGF